MTPQHSHVRGRIQLIIFLTVLLLGVVLIWNLPRVSIPLFISYILALTVKPIVPFFVRLGFSKAFAYFLVLFSFLVLPALPFIKVIPSLRNEADRIQQYIPKTRVFIQTKFDEMKVFVKEKVDYEIETNYAEVALSYVEVGVKEAVLYAPNLLVSILEWILLIPLFTFFLLKDRRIFTRNLLSLVPNHVFERVYYVAHQFNKKLGNYIFAKFVEATILGLIITIGLLLIGVKFSFLLGLVAAITNVIPYLGPVLGIIPAVIIVGAEYGLGPIFFGVMILYAIANVIDLALVFPILLSKIVDIHPVVVVISVIIGSQYLGVVGMVISIPLAAIGKLIFGEIYKAFYPIQSKNS